ncbi:MAG: heme utilization protein, partial [Betaproteobacteria bacterium]|nr:heme utilization protein [Betaproteobacteria bacterium]
AQVAALKTTQIAALSTASVAALKATQLAALSVAGIAALTPEQVTAIKTTQVAALSSAQIAALTTIQLAVLTTEQVAALTTGQMKTLGTATLGALTTAQVAALKATQIAALSTTGIAALQSTQIAGLTTASVAALSATQVAALTTASVAALSPEQIGALKVTQMAALTATQLAALTSGQLSTLKTTQIASLSSAQMSALTAIQIEALTTDQVAALTTGQVKTLSAATIGALTTAQIAALKATQISAMSPAGVAALQPTQIAALTTGSVAALTTAGIAALSTTQIAALTMPQVSALKTSQIAVLSTSQRAQLALASPIIFDLNGDGVRTLSVTAGVKFDVFAQDIRVQTGWVSPEDGLLVLDINQDGVINDGSELFGSSTKLANGANADDGYAALREMDSNHDGSISQDDDVFAHLGVWVDHNSDGVSNADEVKSLDALGITKIDLQAMAELSKDNGNLLGLTSSYETTDGVKHAAADVWFVADKSAIRQTAVALSSAISNFDPSPATQIQPLSSAVDKVGGLAAEASSMLAPTAQKDNLRARVSDLVQAIGMYGDVELSPFKTTQETSSSLQLQTGGGAFSASTSGLAACRLAEVMNQFDANGQPRSDATPASAAFNLNGTADANSSAGLAIGIQLKAPDLQSQTPFTAIKMVR